MDVPESDSPQCGRGDPNLSGISPPLPANLVEPKAEGFETGFHVITGGTEVGISVFKYVSFFFKFFPVSLLPGVLRIRV